MAETYPIRIFVDKELTIDTNGIIDLGTIEAGEVRDYLFYVLNESRGTISNLMFEVKHPEVEVVEYPMELTSKSVGELRLRWTSTVQVEQPQQARLEITGKNLYSYFI